MKKFSKLITATIIIATLTTFFSLFGQYQKHDDQYLRTYAGPIEMRVMRFGQQLSIDIMSPTASLLGYAHRPTSTRDKQIVEEFYNKMQEYFRFVNVSQDGQCRFTELDLDNPFFSLYMNEYEAEYQNKFDEDRGNLNTLNRGVMDRYKTPPKANYNRITRSKITARNKLKLNPYYFTTTPRGFTSQLSGIQSTIGKYQSVSVDRKELNRSRFYVNDKRLTESELRDQRSFEYIYDINKQEEEDKRSQVTPAPSRIQSQPNTGGQFNGYRSDLNQRQTQEYAPQSPVSQRRSQSSDNYNIAKKGLGSGSYQQPMQTETDISIRFLCAASEKLSYVDFREIFDTFPNVTLIYTQVVTEDGQYNIEVDKQNSTAYLR